MGVEMHTKQLNNDSEMRNEIKKALCGELDKKDFRAILAVGLDEENGITAIPIGKVDGIVDLFLGTDFNEVARACFVSFLKQAIGHDAQKLDELLNEIYNDENDKGEIN